MGDRFGIAWHSSLGREFPWTLPLVSHGSRPPEAHEAALVPYAPQSCKNKYYNHVYRHEEICLSGVAGGARANKIQVSMGPVPRGINFWSSGALPMGTGAREDP